MPFCTQSANYCLMRGIKTRTVNTIMTNQSKRGKTMNDNKGAKNATKNVKSKTDSAKNCKSTTKSETKSVESSKSAETNPSFLGRI